MAELHTFEEVVEELGGVSAVLRLTGRRWPSHVSNWKKAGRFPSDTYLILQEALVKTGATAPPELWGIKPAETTTAEH